MAFYQDLPWHEGEKAMRYAMHTPQHENPTVPGLSPQLANHLQIAPLIAIGTLDSQGRPWTTIWGGEAGFARALAQEIVGIRTPVADQHDPVVEELVGKDATGDVVREEGQGRMISGLTINLETRKRVKLFGRMVAGALGNKTLDESNQNASSSTAEIQLVLRIEQSLGNCPKYLNRKAISSCTPTPSLLQPTSPASPGHLPQPALDLLENADLFFISSANGTFDMDTNHRGGPPGFLRLSSNNSATGATLVYPEYSGNRLYQTLGNLRTTPKAGLCIPDFETGNVLYLTGTTRILLEAEAAAMIPRSNLAVEITVTSARFVFNALPFRGTLGEFSPYNPPVRYLTSESTKSVPQSSPLTATLLKQTPLTPSISRFTFSLSNSPTFPLKIKAGQYAALDFSSHLDHGYSHMRDDDPRSLNDDWVRTFTVSSPPAAEPEPVIRLRDTEFEVMVRNVGVVTGFLFQQGKRRELGRAETFEVGVKGFGGEFVVEQKSEEVKVGFLAAGIGITPLLPCLGGLDLSRLRIIWTVRAVDLGLVEDVLSGCEGLGKSVQLFLTGEVDGVKGAMVERLTEMGASVHYQRMRRENVLAEADIERYFICTGTPMRKELMGWLEGKEVVFEEFNF